MNRNIDDEPGQLLLHVLGITKWFSIYQTAGCIGFEAALQKLNSYISSLNNIESIDEDELEQSRILGWKIARMLSYPTNTPVEIHMPHIVYRLLQIS